MLAGIQLPELEGRLVNLVAIGAAEISPQAELSHHRCKRMI